MPAVSRRTAAHSRTLVCTGLLIATCLMVVASPLASEALHANGADGRCQLKNSSTITRSAAVRVFRRNGKTFACLYSVNRRVQLGRYYRDDFGEEGQRNVRIAGRYVALEEFFQNKRDLAFTVHVWDLRRGRRIAFVDTGSKPNLSGDFLAGIGPTTRIRLRATGQVAWITRDISSASPRYEVRKRNRSRRVRAPGLLLASGPDIDPQSLGLVGNTLSWTQGGQRQQATLGRPPAG